MMLLLDKDVPCLCCLTIISVHWIPNYHNCLHGQYSEVYGETNYDNMHNLSFDLSVSDFKVL